MTRADTTASEDTRASRSAGLLLRCQGYPELATDGRVLPLKLKRGMALLFHLSELERKVARHALAELLWPDAPVDVGRGRLRRLCHQVNAVVGHDLIVGDTDAVWLSDLRGPLDSDAMKVRRCAMQWVAGTLPADEVSAIDLLCEDDAHRLLEGFEIDSDAFASWLDGRRADQERLVARALVRIAEQRLAAGMPADAVRAAEALIRTDPLADAGHALLLTARGRLGDAAGVEAAYFACAERLRNELGIRPSEQIEAAYAQATGVPASGHTGEWLGAALPPIGFADTADGAVAFLEIGDRSAPCGTLVVLFGLWSNVEVAWELPRIRAIMQRLARRFHVVLMDRRGVGLSERLALRHSVAAGVEDLEAVRRRLAVDQAWLLGNSVGGTIAVEYAAAHPGRVAGLMLYGTGARSAWADDYPWGLTDAQRDAWLDRLQAGWGSATSLEAFAPNATGDPVLRDWWARMLRQAASRNSVPALLRAYLEMDVRERLPHVRVPTLVVQRSGDRIVRAGAAAYLAERIQGARLELLPGDDHLLWVGDTDAALTCMERFIDDVRRPLIDALRASIPKW
jgi:pimeloyl-ACP methyl ester carboxylesterase/DNA-binding SARP family transcriptional activator